MYSHKWSDGSKMELPVGKVVCIGRNYAEHAQELNNPVPDKPILFMKPKTALTKFDGLFYLEARLGEHHFEAELALLVGETIKRNTVSPLHCIAGVGLALDLTLRDVQAELKAKGHPWERAKAYDNSCPITPFENVNLRKEDQFEYRFWQNGELKQHGMTTQMVFSLEALVAEITQVFTLEPGDVILTGTPKGVGALKHEDQLMLQLGSNDPYRAQVTIE